MNKCFIILFLFLSIKNFSQDTTFVFTEKMFDNRGYLRFPSMDQWLYHEGSPQMDIKEVFNDKKWFHLDSSQFIDLKADENNHFECWFRIKIRLDSTFENRAVFIYQRNSAATDIYLGDSLINSFGKTGMDGNPFSNYLGSQELPPLTSLPVNQELMVTVHFVDKINFYNKIVGYSLLGKGSFLYLASYKSVLLLFERQNTVKLLIHLVLSVTGIIATLFWILTFLIRKEKHLKYLALTVTCIFGLPCMNYLATMVSSYTLVSVLIKFLSLISLLGIFITLPLLAASILKNGIPRWLKIYAIISLILGLLAFFFEWHTPVLIGLVAFIICAYLVITSRKNIHGSKWAIVMGFLFLLVIMCVFGVTFILFQVEALEKYETHILVGAYITFPLFLLIYIALWLKETIFNVQANAEKLINVTNEKKEILENQNMILEQQVAERTMELTHSLQQLKSTQTQLIHSEKMASLGELTAGIAHEIQNPLNFVNNFSDVNLELTQELEEEINNGDLEEAKAIIKDIKANEEKINHHGKRADSIVKGMLLHSRSNSGEKVKTDINALCEEFLRLSYHGFCAKDQSFKADFEMEFDESIPKIEVVPQDIGRVMLNIINNAFQAISDRADRSVSTALEKPLQRLRALEGVVKVSTKNLGDKIAITVSDNGSGIPDDIKDKIFQPFFTTKPTGQGTGLGLSLAYDIVKAHGGELSVRSEIGKGTEFIIRLSIV